MTFAFALQVYQKHCTFIEFLRGIYGNDMG